MLKGRLLIEAKSMGKEERGQLNLCGVYVNNINRSIPSYTEQNQFVQLYKSSQCVSGRETGQLCCLQRKSVVNYADIFFFKPPLQPTCLCWSHIHFYVHQLSPSPNTRFGFIIYNSEYDNLF